MAADCKPNASVDFGKVGAKTVASVCGFELQIPTIPFPPALNINFKFPPALPKIKFGYALTCDPKDPIDITAGLGWGGGRLSCSDESPDQEAA